MNDDEYAAAVTCATALVAVVLAGAILLITGALTHVF
jgi:hypothetical protein